MRTFIWKEVSMETKHSKEPWVNVDALRTNHSMIQSQGRVIAEVWSLDKNTDTRANAPPDGSMRECIGRSI